MAHADSTTVNNEYVAVMLMLSAWRNVPGARLPFFDKLLDRIHHYRSIVSATTDTTARTAVVPATQCAQPLSSPSSLNYLRAATGDSQNQSAMSMLTASDVGNILKVFGSPRERMRELVDSFAMAFLLGEADPLSGDGGWNDYSVLPEISCVMHNQSRSQRLSLALIPMKDDVWDRWTSFLENVDNLATGQVGNAQHGHLNRSCLWVSPEDFAQDTMHNCESRPSATLQTTETAERGRVIGNGGRRTPKLGRAQGKELSESEDDASRSDGGVQDETASRRIRAFLVDNQRTTNSTITIVNTRVLASAMRHEKSTVPVTTAKRTSQAFFKLTGRIQFASWSSMFGCDCACMYNVMCLSDTHHPSLQDRASSWLQTVAHPFIAPIAASEIKYCEELTSRRGSYHSFPECDVSVSRGICCGEVVLIKKWTKIMMANNTIKDPSREDITPGDLRGLRPLYLAQESGLLALVVQDDDEARAIMCASVASLVPAQLADPARLKLGPSVRQSSTASSAISRSSQGPTEDDPEMPNLSRGRTVIHDIHVPYACAHYSADGVVVKYMLYVTLEDGRRWCVGKRFSELAAFHEEVKDLYLKGKDLGRRISMLVGGSSDPPFPTFPSKSVTRGISLELPYILRRRRHLSNYFAELMMHGKGISVFVSSPESAQRLLRLCSPAHDTLFQPDYNLRDQDGFMQVVEKVFVNAYFLAPDYISEQCTDKKLVWAALRRDLPETDDSKRKSLASESTVDGARSRSEKSSAALTPRKLVRGSASRSSLAELSPEFGRCSFSSVSLRGEDMVVSGIIPTFAIALPYARIIYDPNSLERMMIHLRCEKSEQRNEILRRRDEVAGLYEYIASCTSLPGTAEARRFFATLRRDNPPRLFTPYSAVSHGNRDGAASEASSDQALLLTSPSASNESKLQLAISANANEEGLARYPGGPPVVMLAAISHRPRYLETGVCRNSTHEEKKMRSACNTGTDGSSLPSELSSGAVVIEIAEAADLTWQAPQKCTCSETVLCPPKENSFETRYTVATGHVIVVHCPIKGQHRRRVGATSREMKRD